MESEFNDEPTQADFERMERDEYYNRDKTQGCSVAMALMLIALAVCAIVFGSGCKQQSKYEKSIQETNTQYDGQIDSLTRVTDSLIETR